MRKFVWKNRLFGSVFIIFIWLFVVYPFDLNANINLSDINWYKYRESISFLYDNGVVQWYPNGTFGPNLEINRAEIIKIILEASLDADLFTWSNCFVDVKNDRYAKYVCYAKQKGMIKWYTDWTFRPMQKVIFAEALKMWLEWFAIDTNDAGQDNWYQPYIDWSHNNNIFSRYSIIPNKNMTRGEATYLLHQLMLERLWARDFVNQRDVASVGCGKDPPINHPSSSIVNWKVRNYITVIGNKYDKNTPMKIIFAFHGRTNPNTMVRTYYDIEKESQGDAIIIYPAGLPEQWPSRNWSNPWDKKFELRDFALFDQLLEEFENNYCINKDQVFVVGHSLGAWFTNSLSCARGDVIRAIAGVGWWTTINDCNGPVAAMIMQNPDDNLSPYREWVVALDQLLKQNACWESTKSVGPILWNCVEYTDCIKDAPVIRCPHGDSISEVGTYYPHTWPDFAGEYIWEFFEAQK